MRNVFIGVFEITILAGMVGAIFLWGSIFDILLR